MEERFIKLKVNAWDQATSCSKIILSVSKLELVGEYIFILVRRDEFLLQANKNILWKTIS